MNRRSALVRPFPSSEVLAVVGLVTTVALVGCTTQSPALATPETFEAVPCEDLVRSKFDREVELLKLSDSLERERRAARRGLSGSDGWSKLGDSIKNLGHTLELNEIKDGMLVLRVEIAAIEYNLSSRCRR